jgi:hypothetical protein
VQPASFDNGLVWQAQLGSKAAVIPEIAAILVVLHPEALSSPSHAEAGNR